ncbi:MAG TPA: hypothetical protein DCM07_18890 [Planctomycetaceae bacterium]|uniref:zinc-ribbon domain containing protein n=1 Tax=Gimesia sp. TaxID=2024833 RepID=UPI000C5502DC|nr:zinc-ribbon domain containing protein [Gimesia sp.]MAX35739.1 hypothetical protein [Gimesia sp.]HAH46874.1 hypothetical protein [Planctomycetaceae bacterium]HBL47696.1 hypothetical protein [Planctomycetaceae bacterium]|tara:strand:- start:40 stop:591 length:552 start_codon:yes stop_codon:yes gene_type:complete
MNYDEFVWHPRYTDASKPSGHNIPLKKVKASCIAHSNETIYPDSAIPANLDKQTPSCVQIHYYVDILKQCTKCKRKFIFFAQEQKFWYEELGFVIYAGCSSCPECRKFKQKTRHTFQRYSGLVSRNELSDESLAFLVDDVIFLWQNKILKNEHKLGRIKNIAIERIPNHEATRRLLELPVFRK